MIGLYLIHTDYASLANAKAAAWTLVNAHWGWVFGIRINDEPYYHRHISPNAESNYTMTATTTYPTHPLYFDVALERKMI